MNIYHENNCYVQSSFLHIIIIIIVNGIKHRYIFMYNQNVCNATINNLPTFDNMQSRTGIKPTRAHITRKEEM